MLKVCINPSFHLSFFFYLHNTSFIFFLLPLCPLSSFSTCTSSLCLPLHPPWASLRPPGWRRAALWRRPADDWQLRVLWLLMNSDARLCNCNEGQKGRRQGSFLLFTFLSHTCEEIHIFSSRPLPNYSCILLPQPRSPWRGSEGARLKRHRADITFACVSYAGVFLGLCLSRSLSLQFAAQTF